MTDSDSRTRHSESSAAVRALLVTVLVMLVVPLVGVYHRVKEWWCDE